MKTIFSILILLLSFGKASGQTDSLFSSVNQAQKSRLQHIHSDQRDSIYSYFDTKIMELLQSGEICTASPDTSNHYFLVDQLQAVEDGQTLAYAFMNNVVITSSGNLKIYSWDDLGGGPYHTYTNHLLYSDSFGNCKAFPINTKEEDTDVGYYDIKQIDNYYVAFGFGTYGGGKQHYTITVFKEDGDGIESLEEVYIVLNRGQEAALKYNSKENTISYRAYKFNDEIGFYTPEYETVVLHFVNGAFVINKSK